MPDPRTGLAAAIAARNARTLTPTERDTVEQARRIRAWRGPLRDTADQLLAIIDRLTETPDA